MRLNKRKKLSPIEILKKKVGKVVFSDKLEPDRRVLTMEEFTKIAKEVKRTFRNGYPLQPQFDYQS